MPQRISLALLITFWAFLSGQQTFLEAAMMDPIPSVKEYASKIPSPPRLYATSGQAVPLWPDQPGSIKVAGLGTSGIGPPVRHPGASMDLDQSVDDSRMMYQLITSVEPGPDPGETTIVLELSWSADGKTLHHVWRFQVDSAGEVCFVAEEGSSLPPLPI